MYRCFIRPLFFLIDAEKAHKTVVSVVKFLASVPVLNQIIRFLFRSDHPDLKINVAGLDFRNRVGLAAGFDKNADFYREFSMFGFSFIEIGTVTPLAQPGNQKPRLFRLVRDHALINRMGFNNKGLTYAVQQLQRKDPNIIIGGNIGKNTATPNESAVNDYKLCFDALYDVTDYLAINVSCPNIHGLEKLQEGEELKNILQELMKIRSGKSFYKPVFLKISPDLSAGQLDEVMNIYRLTGLDGIIATNTTTRRTGLKTDKQTVFRMGSGGLSGAPLKNTTLKTVDYICKHSKGTIPVIAAGGIMTPDDAIDMIKAGASLVQIYTGFIYEGPFLVKKMNKAIHQYLSGETIKKQ
jgi:dihydroorotate dehydrogenase